MREAEPQRASPICHTGALPPGRAPNAAACQDVPRPVALLKRQITSGSRTGRHSHARDQLLYATSGLMSVEAADATWMVPTGHALLIAADLPHDTRCLGALGLCTAYIAPDALRGWIASGCRIIRVSPLLDATLQALAEEPLLYEADGRGGYLAELVLDEIRRAPSTLFALPLPIHPPLRKLCMALIETPSLGLDIDGWARTIGVGRRTLTRRFRSETSLSFAEWRRRLRVLHAVTQQAGGVPLTAAARSAGYSSVSALRSVIRRATQRPPS